jgi:hypothetical protein
MTPPTARTFEEIAREALGEKTLLPLRCYEIVLACVSTALREAGERGRAETVEKCAQVAENYRCDNGNLVWGPRPKDADVIAEKIRALGEKERG